MIISDSLSPVLCSGPVPDPPLEVSLRVGLNEGVDWANPSIVVGGWGVGRGRGSVASVSPHSGGHLIVSVIKEKHSPRGYANESEEKNLR